MVARHLFLDQNLPKRVQPNTYTSVTLEFYLDFEFENRFKFVEKSAISEPSCACRNQHSAKF